MTEEADILIKNTDVLTLNRKKEELRGVDVAIKGDRVRKMGRALRLDAKQTIEGSGKLLLPGLADCHTHAFQIFLRGALSSKELNAHPLWLKVLIPFEAGMEKDEGDVSAQLACLNMIKKGITAFADAGGPYPEILAETADRAGLRGRVTSSTFDRGPKGYNRDLSVNRSLVSRWKKGRVRGWYSIRQIMISSDELIAESAERAFKDDVGLHIHLNEEIVEVDHSMERWGMRPFEYMHRKGFLSRRTLAAHCAFLSDRETRLIAKDRATVVHCPLAAMTYMTFPKVPRLLELGANVALGSDGGSYRGLDMFVDMNIAFASHIGYHGTPYFDFSVLSTLNMLEMASTNGYRAILQDDGGTVREGGLADLILLNRNQAHLRPMRDLAAIPLFATGNDVSDMIVDGKLVMKDRSVLTMDEDGILQKAKDMEPRSSKRTTQLVKARA